MDDKAGVVLLLFNRFQYLVERHDFIREPLRQQQPQRQKRGGQRTGNGDAARAQFVDLHRPASDDHRAVTVAHAATARQEGVFIQQLRVGTNADRGHVEFAAKGAAVKRLDVLQFMAELQTAGVNFIVGQRVEHKGVVGVGAVADGDEALRHKYSSDFHGTTEYLINRDRRAKITTP